MALISASADSMIWIYDLEACFSVHFFGPFQRTESDVWQVLSVVAPRAGPCPSERRVPP
jgi:hypothetical protein